MDYRNNIKETNNLINLDECKKNIQKKFIGKGGQGSVFKLESKTCGGVVLKTYHKTTNKDEIFKEVNILDKVKKLIDEDICPNFLYYYDFFKINDIFNIIIEYADGDLESWVKVNHTDDEWKNMIFQFIIGIHAIQKYLKGYHSDLKPKNIFFKKINKKGYFEFQVNDKKYYLENLGFLILLADYGHFQSTLFEKNIISDIDIESAIRENQDFDYLRDFVKRIQVTNLIKIYNLDKLKSKFRDNSEFLSYYKLESERVKKELRGYPESVINKYLNRNLLYYCLEHNLINYKEEYKEEKNDDQKTPSEKITKFLESILDEKGDIEDILDKYFKEFQSNKNNIIKQFNLNKFII